MKGEHAWLEKGIISMVDAAEKDEKAAVRREPEEVVQPV
jgi:hypothetical protein